MSYKDGIPLLTTFEDEPSDLDDYLTGSVSPKRRCKKRNVLLIVVFCFAAVLVVGLSVSVALGVTLKQSEGSGPSEGSGYNPESGEGLASFSSLVETSVVATPTTEIVATPTTSIVMMSRPSSEEVPPPSSHAHPLPTSTTAATAVAPSSSTTSNTPAEPASSSPTPPLESSMQPLSTSAVIMTHLPSSSSSSSLSPSPSQPPPLESSSQPAPTSIPELVSSSTAFSMLLPSQTTPGPTPSPTPPPPTNNDDCQNDTLLCPSPNDARDYFAGVLPNGLRVVLTSDPETDLAGASVDVAAGSFNDPPDLEGLAHFCEHMLFLGTHTYPQENLYSNFLSTHGGYDNAFTSTQETNFFFRVNSGYLRRALDLFSHFFIDPLLTEEAAASEMYAVNQEHEKNLHSDGWKLWQLLKHVSNPHHPFSQFSTGNFRTLNKSNVNQQLLSYYSHNYVAENMFLSVYGRENISILWDTVTEFFTAINQSSDPSITLPASYNTTAFPPEYTAKILHYLPEASTNLLTLFWQTPPLQPHPRSAVSAFLTRFLGYEGKGSLLYHLREVGVATSLVAGIEVSADSFDLFSLQVTLTESGLDNVTGVVQAVFHYVYLLADLTPEDFEHKWEDFQDIAEVNFDYAEATPPDRYTSFITGQMRVLEDFADVLPNPRRYQPDHALTTSTASHFTPNNTVIFIGTHRTQTDAQTTPTDATSSSIPLPIPDLDQTEPIYGTNFSMSAIPDNLLAFWGRDEASNAFSELFLPGQNSFIPRNFTILPPNTSLSEPQHNSSDDLSSETWVLPDTQHFPQPRANFLCELRSADDGMEETAALRNARNASAELFVAMVRAELTPLLYGAAELGYGFGVGASSRGVTLEFGGFSDAQVVGNVVSQTLTTLTGYEFFTEDLFNLVKGDLTSRLKNYNYTTLPYRYTISYLQNVLMERPYWKHEQVLAAMQNLTLDDVVEFADTVLLTNLSVSCLAHGNVDQDMALSVSRMVTDQLGDRVSRSPFSPPTGFPSIRMGLLSDSPYGSHGVSLKTLNPDDDNSVVNIIYQAGSICDVTDNGCSDTTLLTALHLSLLRQIIADACFTQLRTREKLGYVAACFTTENEGIGSFQTLVQSEVFTPEHVLNSTLSFLYSYNDTILSADFSEGFPAQVEVLRQTLSKRDLTLQDRTNQLWYQIFSGKNQFDFKQQQVDMLDLVDYDSFTEFYEDLILNDYRRKRVIMVVYGKGKEFDLPVDKVVDYANLDPTVRSFWPILSDP